MVDPGAVTLTVFDLDLDAYVQRAHLSGDEVFEATRPFAVTITPARFVD